MSNKILSVKAKISIRFSDVDSLGIVWHGNYVKFFEDGREAFGKKYGLTNLDFIKVRLIPPVVKLNCDFKKPLMYGDSATIETKYIDSEAAKLIFSYTIFNDSTNEIVATGETTQVFLTIKRVLILTIPPFFENWKKKRGIIK